MNSVPQFNRSTEPNVRITVVHDHAEIVIHTPNEKINKLNKQAWMELYEHVAFLKAKANEIKTVLIWSDKPDMFLAGADITEIEAMTERKDAMALVEKAQEVFQALSELPQVTLCAIDGPCMGGGLELALACKYRICSDSPKTSIGVPEVQLGVLPGAGGTQRLPRVISLPEAIAMITSGAPVNAKKALKIGLVSDVVPSEYLIDFARRALREQKYLNWLPKETVVDWAMKKTPLKKLIFSKARKMILEKTKGHYPAPLRALEVIEKTLDLKDIRQGLLLEAAAFADLAITPICKNLIGIFFGTEELKKERGVGPMEAPDFKPAKYDRMGVLGAGIMGGGIAAVAAKKGIRVRMKDVAHESIMNGLKTAYSLFDKEYKRKKITKADYLKRKYSIEPTLEFTGFEHLPIIVEAVVERMDIKKSVLQDLESRIPEKAIIATNTSSLSVSEMATVLKRPDQFVGMHFFNPVPLMPLVEVVRAEKTSPETVMQTVAFGRQLGKTVIVVKDRPGFLINRILMPFLIESAHLRNDGYSIAQIDRAAVDFGMPMGPFRLLDEIGLDTAAKVAKVISVGYPHMKVTTLIDEIVERGYLGKKNGKGFYNYDPKGKELGIRSEFQTDDREPGEQTQQLIQDRLILPMAGEAVMALDEGVVATVKELDLGLIYGIGFPPFKGGLLKWISSVGERQILDRMHQLHQLTQGRLIVPKAFEQRVQAGQKFGY